VRANRLAFTLTKAGVIWTLDAKAPPFKYLRASASPSASGQVTAMSCEVQLSGQAAADTTGRTCADDPFRLTARTDNGVLGLATLRLPITLDGRDNIFRPHAGYLVTATSDLVLGGGYLYASGTGPTTSASADSTPVRSTFVRFAAGVTGYLPLTRSITLALGGRAGTVVPLGPAGGKDKKGNDTGIIQNYVPLFERFYLGGSDSVRGFTPDGVLPVERDSDPKAPRPLVSQGGNGFWNIRSELRFPLVGPLEGGVFVDAGQLLASWFNDVNLAPISLGVGAGIRVNTPVGPLVLDLGFAVLDGVRGLGVQQSELSRRFVIHPALGYF
jgi:outer membrane protein assembly factor BamA